MAYFTIEGYNSYSGCDIVVTASLPSINGAQPTNKYYTLGSLQTLSISTHQDKRPVRSLGVINAKDYVMGPRTIAGSMVFAVFNKHFATEIMNDLGASGTSVVLPDEIPALNITVSFANEYGRMSRMAIYGVKIINEGQVMSINDLYTENTYQFVALGLEPLNVEINENSKPGSTVDSSKKTSSVSVNSGSSRANRSSYIHIGNEPVNLYLTNSTEALLNDKIFMENSGANLSEQIQNNTQIDRDSVLGLEITNKYDPVILSVAIEQPRNINDYGLATFTLTPEQTQGIIYVYPMNSSNLVQEHSIVVHKKKRLVINLLPGKYQARYVNEFSETSNTVDFVIEQSFENQVYSHTILYPIIEKVTNNSVVIYNSNYEYDTLIYFEEGKESHSLSLNKHFTKIENLNPSTTYKIYILNSKTKNRSEVMSIKTYAEENQEKNMLDDFIETNKNLLINIDENFITDCDYENYNNLIDMVLDMPESIQKQELLIYATELSNQLNTSHNITNPNHITGKIQESPFTTTLHVTDYDSMYIYANDHGKLLYEDEINTTSNPVFYARPNKHYSVYGIIDDGAKSVKTSIAICKNSAMAKLERYRDVNTYKNIDLTSYTTKYNLYNSELVEALAIRDNFYSDISILNAPYIYRENNTVYADINYLTLNRYCVYYLCCSEVYNALDHYPKRKIPFTLDSITDKLRLEDYYLGLSPNKKYLFWIEDGHFMRISKPYLYVGNNATDNIDINKIHKSETNSKLLSIKRDMINVYGDKQIMDDIFNYVNNLNPSIKNIEETLVVEFMNAINNSYYMSGTLTPLYELFKIINNFNTTVNMPDIEIDKYERLITFNNLRDYYICAIYYEGEVNDDDEIVFSQGQRLEEKDNSIQYEHGKGYTIITLVSHNMIYKTGFILINNNDNKIVYTPDLSDYIKEVGGR